MPSIEPVPSSLRSLSLHQEDLLSAPQCDEAGVSVGRRSRLVRDGHWARVTRGVYDADPRRDRRWEADHRRRRAAWLGILAYGPSAISVGSCALALLGVGGLPGDISPEIAMPRPGARPRPGIRLRHDEHFETMRLGQVAVAELVPALVQALPDLPRRHAVAVLDDVLRRGLLTDTALAEVRHRLRGRRGAAHLAALWPLVDRRSESPLETFARLECVDAGVPPDELQVEIRDRLGRLLGRGDLGWRRRSGRWLIAEIDGREFHEAPEALLRDRRRQNDLVATGRVDILRFTAVDIATPGLLPTTIRSVLAAD